MNKSMPKRKQGISYNRGSGMSVQISWTALNGGTLSLFFNEDKKETLDFSRAGPENEMKNIIKFLPFLIQSSNTSTSSHPTRIFND